MKYLEKFLKRRSVFIGLLVAFIISAIVLVLTSQGAKATSSAKSKPLPAPTIAVVEITATGFVPNTLAVNPNTKVIWINEDAMPHLPAAGPYPTRADMPNLIAPRALGQKETYSFLFTKAGTIQYDDNLDPSLSGTIEVR